MRAMVRKADGDQDGERAAEQDGDDNVTTATNDEGSGKKGKQSDSYQAGTKQGAKNYKEGDKGRKDTRKPNDFYQVGTKHTDFTRAPTNDYQAGTKQSDSYQAGTKQGAKNYEEEGKGRQDTREPTDSYQVGTKHTDFYQAETETRVKKPGRGRGADIGQEYMDVLLLPSSTDDVYLTLLETAKF